MFKFLYIYVLSCIFFLNNSYGQYLKQIDSICMLCNHAKSDSEKIIMLDKLAEYYYIYKLSTKADSALHEELQIADLSNNSNLKFTALFGNAILNISPATTTENFDKTIQFLQDGIDYAVSQNNYDYTGLGYARLSYILRKRGNTADALDKSKLAIESLPYINNDSLKSVMYIELGNAYADKGDLVAACKSYNKAFDFALTIKSVPLQSDIHHYISSIYSSLNLKSDAINELEKSLAMDKAANYNEGVVRDYYDLARLTDEKYFITNTLKLAQAINYPYYTLQAKRLMLAYIFVIERNADKAISYLENETDLKQSYLNVGISSYNNAIGQIYLYSGDKPDSAIKYFKLAEYDYIKNFDQGAVTNIFFETAKSYQLLNDWPNAISYYRKVLVLATKLDNIKLIADVSDTLSNLYDRIGDYNNAYKYSRQTISSQNTIKERSKANDIALLGVVRENREHEEKLKIEELAINRQRNLQYMFISIVICVVFITMLVVGAFPVSKVTIRMFGYLFFISLFEFIVLFIDNTFFSKTAHSEPLKLWLIKIALIACLVPIQHFLEHNLIKFLQSRKLLEARTKFSLKKIWKTIFKPNVHNEQEIEEDTAVL